MRQRRAAAAPAAVAISIDIAAANPPHAAATVDRWDRHTDGQTPFRYINPAAYYARPLSINHAKFNCLESQGGRKSPFTLTSPIVYSIIISSGL